MSDQIRVGFSQIDNLASGINSQVKQIESQLDDLRQAIAKLAQMWEGSANEAFQSVQNNWNQSATDLNGVLNRIALAVQAANEAYQNTEKQNTSVWS